MKTKGKSKNCILPSGRAMVHPKAGKTLTIPPSLTKPALTLRLQGTKTRTPAGTKSKKDTTSFLDCIDEEDEENNITDKVDVNKEDTSPLSLLRKFPYSAQNNNNNELSPETRKLYASAVDSVKKLLVSELLSNSNVGTMVELVNKAFETLDWLHADYGKLYDAVKALLSKRAQLFSTESELRKHRNEEADALLACEDNRTRAKEAVEALARSEAEYMKVKVRLGQLKEEVGVLEGEWERCLESHLAIKSVGEVLAVQEEEKRKIVEKIKQRCDEVEAGIEQSIMLLSSLG